MPHCSKFLEALRLEMSVLPFNNARAIVDEGEVAFERDIALAHGDARAQGLEGAPAAEMKVRFTCRV